MYEEKKKTECHGSRYSKLGNVTDRDLAVTKGGRGHDLPPRLGAAAARPPLSRAFYHRPGGAGLSHRDPRCGESTWRLSSESGGNRGKLMQLNLTRPMITKHRRW
jgi:hypothetical protein